VGAAVAAVVAGGGAHVGVCREAARADSFRSSGSCRPDAKDVDGRAALHQLGGQPRPAAKVQVHEARQHVLPAVALLNE